MPDVTVPLSDLSDRALLLRIHERLDLMSDTAVATDASVTNLEAKVDSLIALVTPSIQTLRDQLAAAQALVASLQAGDAADATLLAGTLAGADAEAAKVQSAIDALTPTTPPAP